MDYLRATFISLFNVEGERFHFHLVSYFFFQNALLFSLPVGCLVATVSLPYPCLLKGPRVAQKFSRPKDYYFLTNKYVPLILVPSDETLQLWCTPWVPGANPLLAYILSTEKDDYQTGKMTKYFHSSVSKFIQYCSTLQMYLRLIIGWFSLDLSSPKVKISTDWKNIITFTFLKSMFSCWELRDSQDTTKIFQESLLWGNSNSWSIFFEQPSFTVFAPPQLILPPLGLLKTSLQDSLCPWDPAKSPRLYTWSMLNPWLKRRYSKEKHCSLNLYQPVC